MTVIGEEFQNDRTCKFCFRRHGQGNPLEQLTKIDCALKYHVVKFLVYERKCSFNSRIFCFLNRSFANMEAM